MARGLPQVIIVPGAGTRAPAGAAASIVPGAVPVYDRGCFDFALIQRHLDRSSTVATPFVMRMREPGERSPQFDRHEERPLGTQDRAAGVLSDQVGRRAGSQHRTAPDGRLREVVIRSPGEPGGVIRLVTNLLDVPAE